jgi:molybdopterin molybdotransferase
VVQVRLQDGQAEPLFGLSALLSMLTAADGYVIVDQDATGLAAGTAVAVRLYT